MQYTQRCPSCAGGQAVAVVDAERYTRRAEENRRAAAEALFRADRADQNGHYQHSVQAEASQDHRGEAALYNAMAERDERRAKRALSRLIRSSLPSCRLCGDGGRITGNGSAAIGGPPTRDVAS